MLIGPCPIDPCSMPYMPGPCIVAAGYPGTAAPGAPPYAAPVKYGDPACPYTVPAPLSNASPVKSHFFNPLRLFIDSSPTAQSACPLHSEKSLQTDLSARPSGKVCPKRTKGQHLVRKSQKAAHSAAFWLRELKKHPLLAMFLLRKDKLTAKAPSLYPASNPYSRSRAAKRIRK